MQSQVKEQDAHLDILESSLKRLGSLGKGIQEELELQNKMLNELEEDVERGAANLDTVQGKLDYMIKRAGYVFIFILLCSEQCELI
jgi:chromosome segregation ATPase